MTEQFTVYLDVCALNRPFDDQTQGRVRLETDAIVLVLQRIEDGEWKLLGSEAITGRATVLLTTDDKFVKRARQLRNTLQVRVENPVVWYTEITAND